MRYTSLEQLAQRVFASKQPKRILAAVAPEDAHSLEALIDAQKNGLVNAVLLGNAQRIQTLLEKMGEPPAEYEIRHYDTPEAAAYAAGLMIKDGTAHFIMKGLIPTGLLLKTLFKEDVGFRVGKLVSHLSILQVPTYHKLVAITDAAINIEPSLEQKAILMSNAVRTLQQLGIETPKVAVLSATEQANPKIADSLDGAALKQMYVDGKITGCLVEGPISYDLAVSKEAAAIKGVQGAVYGDADLLLCPNLTTANVLLKALRYAAQAQSAGIVVGGKSPIVLTSRAAAAQDKYWPMVLAASATL